MKKCEIELKKNIGPKNMWSILHLAVATNHLKYKTTIIEAPTKKKALQFFNNVIVDDFLFMKAKMKNVSALKVGTFKYYSSV